MTKKFDQNKTDWSSVPWKSLMTVAEVMSHGSKKYGKQNWRTVENGTDRYFSAAMRHMSSWKMGEITDHESGKPHLAHAICSLMFLMAIDDLPLAQKKALDQARPEWDFLEGRGHD